MKKNKMNYISAMRPTQLVLALTPFLVWRHNVTMPRSPFAQFLTWPEVKFHVFKRQKHGEGKSKNYFWYSCQFRFDQTNKKNLSYTLQQFGQIGKTKQTNLISSKNKQSLYHSSISWRLILNPCESRASVLQIHSWLCILNSSFEKTINSLKKGQ